MAFPKNKNRLVYNIVLIIFCAVVLYLHLQKVNHTNNNEQFETREVEPIEKN